MKHGALDRFGITLLHSHFAVFEGETLLETCDEDTRTLSIAPVATDALVQSEIVGTSWRFGPTGEVLSAMACGNACVASGGSHSRKHVKTSG